MSAHTFVNSDLDLNYGTLQDRINKGKNYDYENLNNKQDFMFTVFDDLFQCCGSGSGIIVPDPAKYERADQ